MNISLDAADAMELAQLLQFLDDWLARPPESRHPLMTPARPEPCSLSAWPAGGASASEPVAGHAGI
ncbi:MAG: hypothetical protein JWM19_676 [Actinomycetia bacterium]|nr:hypothetical protein [Actinomycetes bacterium]